MKNKISLNFKYKGKRKYVQGPDIVDGFFNTVQYDLSKVRNIKYSAHEWITNNADCEIIENLNSNKKSDSIITFKIDNIEYTALINDNKKQISDSYIYSEEEVFNNSIINNNSIEFVNTVPYSFAEIVVSMNKCYLSKTVTSEGKWIVTKLEFDHYISISDIKNSTFRIELVKNFKNKLTKSSIYLDGAKVGFVYFSLV